MGDCHPVLTGLQVRVTKKLGCSRCGAGLPAARGRAGIRSPRCDATSPLSGILLSLADLFSSESLPPLGSLHYVSKNGEVLPEICAPVPFPIQTRFKPIQIRFKPIQTRFFFFRGCKKGLTVCKKAVLWLVCRWCLDIGALLLLPTQACSPQS